MTLKLNWEAFSHYYIKYDSLFLVMKDTNETPIAINKSEVSDAEFGALKSFIEKKITPN
ncbi:MAG: hypothetical protein KBB37_13495 [Bacteroidia bacterium]|nr:hypothetical protein [Bacteroidia bacterium]MBP7262293.1 hypothetical protein [Bacteroidia bacterium]MBP9179788.1 hypothetical protein [Bacteroidia bacterium]